MIKKLTIKSINITIILSLFIITLFPVQIANAATTGTLKEYKNELAKVQSEKDENNRLTESTKASIDSKRNAIIEANDTISSNEQKVEDSKALVAESQEQIKIKTIELQDVINILQYSNNNSDDVYLDYLFDSNSLTDLMERQAIVKQIVEYTQKELDSLNDLITENESLQVKLADDNVTLANSITEYESQVEELEEYINSLATIGLDYDDKIKAMQSQVSLFEKAGCKDDDNLNDCYYNKSTGSGYFSRPLNSGRVTQAWGNNGHKGIDLGGNSPGTNVYAPADGTVAYVAYHQSCGGNEIYIHFKVNGQAYTGEFAHLRSINVSTGQNVKKGQVIGTVGGDSTTWYYDKCTSGTHLHYSIAYGYYLGSGTNGYSKWSTFTTNTKATSVQSITGIKNTRGWTWSTRG